MKKVLLSGKAITVFLIFFTIVLQSGNVFGQRFLQAVENPETANFYDIKKAANEFWKNIPKNERRGWKQYKRWENFWEQRVYPTGEFPNPIDIMNEIDFFNRTHDKNSDKAMASSWTLLGPKVIPEETSHARGQGLGRINVVRFHPTNDNIFWVGTASGGIWKTTDGGATWVDLPMTQFMSIAISDIAVCPTNPDILYAATGDANGSFSTAGEFYSVGVIKSTDGGDTWSATGIVSEMENRKLYTRILVDPDNENVLIVASNSGIQKSTDGGDTWQTKSSAGYFKDLEFKPDDKNIIYASTFSNPGGTAAFWRSSDFGETWTQILRGGELAGASRIALAVTPDNPDLVYGLAAQAKTDGFHSFWISGDAGLSYEITAITETTNNILGRYDGLQTTTPPDSSGQGWYDLCLAISPDDESEIFTGGINVWKSADQGYFFEKVTHWQKDGNAPFVHADHHDLMFQPGTGVLFNTNDGGIWKSSDKGVNWTDLTEGMSISQFYRFSCSQTDPNMIIGGAQDNGTSLWKDGKWTHVNAGDGMDCQINPVNPKYIYASTPNGNISMSNDGGNSFTYVLGEYITGNEGAWLSPLVLDPSNPDIVYAGFRDIWRSQKNGELNTWVKISDINAGSKIQYIAVSPSDSKTVYASSNRTIYKTKNLIDWSGLTCPGGKAITYIAVDPVNPDRFWVSVSGYSDGQKIYEYDGSEWINISGNLPNVPVNCIVYQNNSPNRIYAGTDVGVYVTENNTKEWTVYGENLPHIIVNDIEIQYTAKKLRIATYGRGIWETDIVVNTLDDPDVSVTGELEFCKGDSVIFEAPEGFASYDWSNGETTRIIVVKESGNYSVIVTDSEGNTGASTPIKVEVYPQPDLDIVVTGGDFPLCEGMELGTLTLTAPEGLSDFKWASGETTLSITIDQLGTYSYTGATEYGCQVSGSIDVIINPLPDKPEITREHNTLISSEAVTYQWYKDDSKLLGQKDQTLDLLVDKHGIGDYTVEISDDNGCENTSEPFNVATSVKETLEDNTVLSIHPNPSSGIFNISLLLEQATDLRISVKNLVGEELFAINEQHYGGAFNEIIDLNNFANGVYFLNISYDGKLIVRKIVKE